MSRRWGAALVWALAGCGSQLGPEAGACADGADNDDDGLTDCNDPDCDEDDVCSDVNDTDADTDTDTPNDTGTTPTFFQGDTKLTTANVSCAGSAVTVQANTIGWTSSALINWVNTGQAQPWDEEHTLLSVDFDPAGAWDVVERTLATGAGPSVWVPDASTVFDCGQFDAPGTMTYALRVYDPYGDYSDCVAWGHDAPGLIAGSYPGGNPVSNPAELANCRPL